MKFALLDNMSRLHAAEVIRERGRHLTPECLRDLTLRATGDQSAADDAYAKQINRLERDKCLSEYS